MRAVQKYYMRWLFTFEQLTDNFTEMIKSIPKGKLIQLKGELNTKIYIVKKGLLRSYSIDDKGKEHIFMFAPEGWILSDNVTPDQPSKLFVDAIENSDVEILTKDNIYKNMDMKKIRRRLEVLQNRIIMLMSASATERYDHFLETYPDIVQRVSQKMIASYLGITPQALSKIRKQKTKS